jgi:hypothetical protein
MPFFCALLRQRQAGTRGRRGGWKTPGCHSERRLAAGATVAGASRSGDMRAADHPLRRRRTNVCGKAEVCHAPTGN